MLVCGEVEICLERENSASDRTFFVMTKLVPIEQNNQYLSYRNAEMELLTNC